MDEQQLMDRLVAHVAGAPIGHPPVEEMRTAVRRRRGRTAALAAAAAVAVVAAGSVGWQLADRDPKAPLVASDPPADPDLPPAGHSYVGMNRAVVAVPDGWGTNDTECGTPQKDTVVIDPGFSCLALVPRAEGVESIEVRPPYETRDIGGWTELEIAGQRALRAPDQVVNESGGAAVARGTVYLPSEGVMFVAESSSPDGAAVVDRLLDGIDVLEEHITVPGFQDLTFQRGPGSMIERYEGRLHHEGLAGEVVREPSRFPEGTLLGSSPAVGSVVAPGDRVRVIVSG